MSKNPKGFLLYKIYYSTGLVYLGRTKQPLNTRLRGHFYAKPIHKAIDISLVTKIEYASFATEADMFLYEIYYINKLKPPINRDDKAKDNLTVRLPEKDFVDHWPRLMEKWRGEVAEQERVREQTRKNDADRQEHLRELRMQLREGAISEDEYYSEKERLE